jgi:hypothetical protein
MPSHYVAPPTLSTTDTIVKSVISDYYPYAVTTIAKYPYMCKQFINIIPCIEVCWGIQENPSPSKRWV